MTERRTRAEKERLKRFFPGMRDPLLLSALEGEGGRAFESREGTSALVISRGFIYLGGQAREGFFRQAEPEFPPCFLTFCGSPAWLHVARRFGADVPMTRFRLERPEAFDREALCRLAQPPAGYTLKTGDEATWAHCMREGWSEDLASLYPDAAAFARDGLMIAAYAGDALAAGCGAYARTDRDVEIEIGTHAAHRRRGLARCCAARFLLQCEEKGLHPHWDAMTKISRDLALQVGFVGPRAYRVVCREEIHGGCR